MKLQHQSVSHLALLSLCCVLITVEESGGTFVPGRCLCPRTERGIRGQLKELVVYPKSPSCNQVTVIVTMKKSNAQVCLNPEAPLGKKLIHCWKRAHKLGRDVRLCLKGRRRRGRGGKRQRAQQRSRAENMTASPSL